ncbi:hypothetical protein BDI4_210031 [Burkholderia diffusa]|nr:hypothetical protein BDI4_210031 [Burkholderia diffusa]
MRPSRTGRRSAIWRWTNLRCIKAIAMPRRWSIQLAGKCSGSGRAALAKRRWAFFEQLPEGIAERIEGHLSECLFVRHKLMAKEPFYATQMQGRSDD